MAEFWLAAFGLFLVIEGLVPAINPDYHKRMMEMLAQIPSTSLRMAGLSSMIVGVLLITLVR